MVLVAAVGGDVGAAGVWGEAAFGDGIGVVEHSSNQSLSVCLRGQFIFGVFLSGFTCLRLFLPKWFIDEFSARVQHRRRFMWKWFIYLVAAVTLNYTRAAAATKTLGVGCRWLRVDYFWQNKNKLRFGAKLIFSVLVIFWRCWWRPEQVCKGCRLGCN